MRFVLVAAFAILVVAVIMAHVEALPRMHFEIPVFFGCQAGSKGKMDKCAAKIKGTYYCFCSHDFDMLNRKTPGGHYLALSGAQNGFSRQLVQKAKANGNGIAYYVNDMHKFESRGAGTGDAIWKDACKAFGGCKNVPKFFILNEIKSERWPSSSYRNWIALMVKGLKKHGVKPVVFVSPKWSMSPSYGSSFKAITDAGGYLALELYLDAQQARANGFSQRYIASFYSRALNQYLRMGIPRNRIMATEDYANSKEVPYGRFGISDADWIKLIKLRNKAIGGLKFGGTLGYGWFYNSMQQTVAQKDRFYRSHLATRNSMP